MQSFFLQKPSPKFGRCIKESQLPMIIISAGIHRKALNHADPPSACTGRLRKRWKAVTTADCRGLGQRPSSQIYNGKLHLLQRRWHSSESGYDRRSAECLRRLAEETSEGVKYHRSAGASDGLLHPWQWHTSEPINPPSACASRPAEDTSKSG